MSDCCGSACDTSTTESRALSYPGCQGTGNPVQPQTLFHQLKHPLNMNLPEQGLFFIEKSHCDIVYNNHLKDVPKN